MIADRFVPTAVNLVGVQSLRKSVPRIRAFSSYAKSGDSGGVSPSLLIQEVNSVESPEIHEFQIAIVLQALSFLGEMTFWGTNNVNFSFAPLMQEGTTKGTNHFFPPSYAVEPHTKNPSSKFDAMAQWRKNRDHINKLNLLQFDDCVVIPNTHTRISLHLIMEPLLRTLPLISSVAIVPSSRHLQVIHSSLAVYDT